MSLSQPRAKPDVKRYGRQPLLDPLKTQAAQPCSIKRKKSVTPVRKSARLQELKRLCQQPEIQEQLFQLPSPSSLTPDKERPKGSVSPSNLDRKRKRSEELGQNYTPEAKGAVCTPSQRRESPARKRQRTSPAHRAVATPTGHRGDTKHRDVDPIQRWIEEGSWSGANVKQDSMTHSLTRKRSTPSLSKNESDITGASLREGKNPLVTSRRYETVLESACIYMGNSEVPPTNECRSLCKTMLYAWQPTPPDTIFRDDLFEKACENIRNKNETRVIQDIARLIVPSPETLTLFGATHLKHLIESTNEGWYKSISLIIKGPRPQPDFAVGLKSTAFTSEQLKKLSPSIGGWETGSCIVVTDQMYFPFLTAEVKCGNEALNIADRQNAHSAAVAANAVVELYRLVSRQDEINQKILAFSISHDNEAIRMYGHYAVIKEKDTLFYRYPIKKFDFTSEDGKEKWTPYTFTRNVYDKFYPIHHERICSAVDQLPDPEGFAVEPFSQQSNLESFEQNDSQLTTSYSQQTESGLRSSQTSEPVFKRPKGRDQRGEAVLID